MKLICPNVWYVNGAINIVKLPKKKKIKESKKKDFHTVMCCHIHALNLFLELGFFVLVFFFRKALGYKFHLPQIS